MLRLHHRAETGEGAVKSALCAGLIALGMGLLVGPGVAAANTSTTTPAVPTDCQVVFSTGPTRAVHSSPATLSTPYSGPDCSQVAGFCLYVSYVDGPSRAVHGRPTRTAGEPCVPLGPACELSIFYASYQTPTAIIDIPADCEELMVLALTPTGSDTAPTLWIATAFLGAGAVLIIAPRRLARR